MWFGSNGPVRWAEIAPQVSNMTMMRHYSQGLPQVDGVPSEWVVPPDGASPFLSIYPDPVKFLAGELDDAMIAFLRAAPAHGWLNTYHEPNVIHRVTPGQARGIHARLQPMVHEYAPQIRYGPVLLATGDNLAQWVIDGLDFYAVDVYAGTAGLDAPEPKLDHAYAQLPGTGRKGVAETNTSLPGRRPDWFWGVYHWLADHHAYAMITFWNPAGSLSGPWLPGDSPTIQAMNDIAVAAAPAITVDVTLPQLQQGMRDPVAGYNMVHRLQGLLAGIGAAWGDTQMAGLARDGDFGPDTARAVQAAQHRFGLAADGIVGPTTWPPLLQGHS